MAATRDEPTRNAPQDATTPGPRSSTIDPNAPAGSKNSLGEESIRDGRPSTDENTVEAIDEETPATPASLPQ
jgi:hypothetical protein